ncbi:hypothetical protein AXG93_913s1020 [Marchantia polymorpha subsp. ruderalis]|uniref:Uncharacterized protein n=1 Tax=Marchantia polymorpha subsp. ruderalis TaxID=1480154 RepID=A0A176VHN4_MARPO|nr:hypothetical protein AXG93_913s1020 [Marchantia polymorpha subsp. ruderalis]
MWQPTGYCTDAVEETAYAVQEAPAPTAIPLAHISRWKHGVRLVARRRLTNPLRRTRGQKSRKVRVTKVTLKERGERKSDPSAQKSRVPVEDHKSLEKSGSNLDEALVKVFWRKYDPDIKDEV